MMSDECYAQGGEVEGDDSALLDHVALECMHAIEMKDKDMFLSSFKVLVAHICESMTEQNEDME